MKVPKPNDRRVALPLLLIAAIAATTTGCTSLAEDVATHLAEKDVKALDQEFKLFEADLGLFRKCLKERGGTCQGSDATALQHSSQHGASQGIAPVSSGPSQTLADSVGQLPAGDPAKGALAVLGHPVVQQAAALHDHLRGHDTGGVAGVSVEKGKGAHGGPESTVAMSMSVGHVQHFHKGLLSSLGGSGWESLHQSCQALLAAPAGVSDRAKLEADCRRVAFVRGYLEAYARSGRFLTVDVQATGVTDAASKEASRITGDLYSLQTDLRAQLMSDLPGDQTADAQGAVASPCAPPDGASGTSDSARSLTEVQGDAKKVAGDVEALIDKVDADLRTRLGKDGSAAFSELKRLSGEVDAQSETLTQAVDKGAEKEVWKAVGDLDETLGKICTEVDKAVAHLASEFTKANEALRNKVFRVSNVGFVSRDATFGAKLPSLELTLDPTGKHLFGLTAYQGLPPSPGGGQTDGGAGTALNSTTDFGHLGVVTQNSSGVATGSSIGAEVVRVFLEAIFDAHEGLPAVSAATGLTLGKEHSLPSFSPPMGDVSLANFNSMTHTNDRVAAGTKAIMSRIIAGIGPFSLNNQPLEDFIVEIIATSVRQATAKATWCWYACNLDQDVKTLEADAKTAVEDKVEAEKKKVEHAVKAEEKKAEDAVKAKEKDLESRAAGLEDEARKHATEEVEHVKLRLKLTK